MKSRQKMAWRSETEVKEELDIKEEFYELSMGGVNYKNTPEKYQTITASPSPSSPVMRCRLCALPNDDMVDIFTVHKTEDESIIDKIECCLRIVVEESDNRPKQVCEFCSEKLELCYQFNKIVEEAERQFRASEEEHSTGLSVKNILVLATLEPSSGSLDPNENLCSNDLTTRGEKKLSSKNEYEKGDSSTFDSDSERTSVFDILEQTTRAFEVSTTSCSRSQPKKHTSSAQCERGTDNHQNLVVSDGPDTNKRCCSNKSVVFEIKREDLAVPEESDTQKERSRSHSTRMETMVKTYVTQENKKCEKTSISSSDLKRLPKKLKKRDCCCIVCGRSFKLLSLMKRHMVVHSDERSWECDYCKKCFKTKGHVRQHVTSCQYRIYNCDFCTALFATEDSLLRHKRLHTRERRHYSCDYCRQKFLRKRSRDRHHLAHIGERPFICSICAKTFTRLDSLQRHAEVHSTKKKFPCSLCDKSYTRAKTRRDHMAAVHVNEKP